MAWYVYKCNNQNNDYQGAFGDWQDFFNNPDQQWGHIDWTPDLERLDVGDMVIAYQTERNELVGVARVRQACDKDGHVYLDAVERIGAKVRPLKRRSSRIAAIPA